MTQIAYLLPQEVVAGLRQLLLLDGQQRLEPLPELREQGAQRGDGLARLVQLQQCVVGVCVLLSLGRRSVSAVDVHQLLQVRQEEVEIILGPRLNPAVNPRKPQFSIRSPTKIQRKSQQ